MQYKIPQEVDVEDKIIGPFTLKGFGFVFAGIAVTTIFAILLKAAGISLFSALLIGGLFGSLPIILGFVPFNGRPMYTFTSPLINFFTRPRLRVWKKEIEIQNPQTKNNLQKNNEDKSSQATITTAGGAVRTKESIDSVEGRIEEISLVVDTGGSYGARQINAVEPSDIFTKNKGRVEQELKVAKEKVAAKNNYQEPTISKVATIDPGKEFKYEKPDTSKYKIDETIKRGGK